MELDFGKIFALLDWITKLIQKYTAILFGAASDGGDENQNAHLDEPAQGTANL